MPERDVTDKAEEMQRFNADCNSQGETNKFTDANEWYLFVVDNKLKFQAHTHTRVLIMVLRRVTLQFCWKRRFHSTAIATRKTVSEHYDLRLAYSNAIQVRVIHVKNFYPFTCFRAKIRASCFCRFPLEVISSLSKLAMRTCSSVMSEMFLVHIKTSSDIILMTLNRTSSTILCIGKVPQMKPTDFQRHFKNK